MMDWLCCPCGKPCRLIKLPIEFAIAGHRCYSGSNQQGVHDGVRVLRLLGGLVIFWSVSAAPIMTILLACIWIMLSWLIRLRCWLWARLVSHQIIVAVKAVLRPHDIQHDLPKQLSKLLELPGLERLYQILSFFEDRDPIEV